MQDEARKLKAKDILDDMGIKEAHYLGQGFEGVVFHDSSYVYKVIMPFFKGKNKWNTYRHLTFFFEKEDFKSFYHLEEVIEYQNVFIQKYKYEPSTSVDKFTQKDVVLFLTECWQKKIIVQDCKKENFIRVGENLKLVDMDASVYYSDNLFLNACIRMYLFLHEQDNPQLKKLQRSAVNNFDLPQLEGAREFINEVFSSIIFAESKMAFQDMLINKFSNLEYEIYNAKTLPHLEDLFFSKIKENLYLCDIQISDIVLNKNNDFEPQSIAIGYKSLLPLKEKISLLIKTCAQDVQTIEVNIKHIVRQLSYPNGFYEVVVSIDTKQSDFARQFTDNADFKKLIDIVENLRQKRIIDRFVIYDTDETTRINKEWFNVETSQTHSATNIPISSQLYAFEKCEGDYVLQMDSDVLIGRLDINHSFLADMISEVQKNKNVLFVGFNIYNRESKAYFGFENGGFVPEVRMGLFDKRRLFSVMPLPNTVDENLKLQLTWYRSLEKLQKDRGFCSIRGGDRHSYYIHPQNYRKTNAYSWMNILDRVEQGYIPNLQFGEFDCNGSFYDWCMPKRSEKMIVISCFRDLNIHKFLRMWFSLISQTFQEFGVIFYDDCSNSGISIFIEQIIKPYKNKVTFIKGRTLQTKMQCEYLAIHYYCDNPESIIVCVDTDDALIGKEALFDIYKKYDMWGVDMTCGRVHQTYRLEPHYRYPVNFMEPRKTGGNVWQHLKTFKKYLFDSIPLSYFMYEDKEVRLSKRKWIEKCDDYAMMVPIAQMSSSPLQMDFINYYYERDYDKKDANRELKEHSIKEILEKPPLSPKDVVKGRKKFISNLDMIEIDITFECNLKCKGCNRSCGYAPSSESMTIDDIKCFINESKFLGKKWKLINILGGEPTLHKDFLRIIEILQREYADSFYPDVIIQVVSNGFTKQTKELCKQAELFKNVRIDYGSFKTKNLIDYFTPFNDAPIDDINFKDADCSAACWVASYCGIGLNKNGYYGCSVCGSIDRVLRGDKGVKSLKEITTKKLQEHFKEFCKYCGNFKDYAPNHGDFIPRYEKAPFKEKISPSWERIYDEYKRCYE